MDQVTLLGFELARAMILTSVDGGRAEASDVRARIDQRVELHAAVELRHKKKRDCAIVTSASQVASRCRRIDPPEDWTVAWSKIEAGQKAYDNRPDDVFTPALIEWIESPWLELGAPELLAGSKGGFTRVADVQPIVRTGIRLGGRAKLAGTMRYRVTITAGAVTLSSTAPPALAGGPPRSIDARKVSLRLDDSYVGIMTELGGLPYIYGSSHLGREPHQAERGIGADCADLMLYGLRRLGHRGEYLSSGGLNPISRSIVKPTEERFSGKIVDVDGNFVRVGEGGVRPGDWLIFPGHVAAFFEDRGKPGVLDDDDLMMHVAWKELAIESITDGGYADVRVEVRRPLLLRADPKVGTVLERGAPCRSRSSPAEERELLCARNLSERPRSTRSRRCSFARRNRRSSGSWGWRSSSSVSSEKISRP